MCGGRDRDSSTYTEFEELSQQHLFSGRVYSVCSSTYETVYKYSNVQYILYMYNDTICRCILKVDCACVCV